MVFWHVPYCDGDQWFRLPWFKPFWLPPRHTELRRFWSGMVKMVKTEFQRLRLHIFKNFIK